MLALLLILVLAGVIIYTITHINRKRSGEEVEIIINENPECCGAHEVCDAESLQIVDTKIEYFDDEELDGLAGISPDSFSDFQIDTLSGVFYSMQESDVAGWLKSLQLRNIQLPAFLREEALMIVTERRG